MTKTAFTLAFLLLILASCKGAGKDASIVSDSTDPLSASGEDAYWSGEYEEARQIWMRSLDQARKEQDPLAEARVMTWLGLVAYRQGDYETARDWGVRALTMKREHGFAEELFKSYNALGLISWDQGRFAEAERLFTQGLEAATAVHDPDGIAKATNNLGLIQTELGQFEEARASFEKALEAGSALEDPRIVGTTLSNLGMLEVRAGEPAAALGYLRRARSEYRSAEHPAGDVNTLGQMGTAYAEMGDLGSAYAAIDSALSLARELGLRQEESSNLELIAGLYGLAGDHERALSAYEQAIALNEELGLDWERGNDLRAAAEIALGLGDLEGAEERARGALAIHETLGAIHEEFDDRLVLAEIAESAGRQENADEHLSRADALSDSLGIAAARVQLALTTARILTRRENYPQVLHLFDTMTAEIKEGDHETFAEVALLRSKALSETGSPEAIETARDAVQAHERIRSSIGSAAIRTSYLSSRRNAYALLVDQLIKAGDVEGAFAASEMARSTAAVFESLATSGKRTYGREESREILRRVDVLVETLEELDRADAEDPGFMDPRARGDIENRLRLARNEYETLRIRREEHDRNAGPSAGSIELRAVQSMLHQDEALLTYLMGPERLHIFVITAESARYQDRPFSGEELTGRIRLARERIATRQDGSIPVLASLYDQLVREPLDLVPGSARLRRLILVTDGALAYLPFAALQDSRTGRYLVESHVLVHKPLASSIATRRSRAPGTIQSAAVFAPFPGDLPATTREASAIEREIEGTDRYDGEHATERALRRALSTQDVVHVATHGVLTPASPLFSRIELAVDRRRAGPEDDGRLEVHEIDHLRASAELLFLSGCETGLGTSGATVFSQGEDYATLTRAFLEAGAGSIVATLWRIEDESAARFASGFYRHLNRTDPAQALAWTQRQMLRGQDKSAPFYWAAYRLSGGSRAQTGESGTGVASSTTRG